MYMYLFERCYLHISAACYEIPTCYDQENLDFWDTHGVDETLFDLLYPNPTYHFPVDFPVEGGRPWLDLTWSLDETDLSEGTVVQNEGVGINEGKFRKIAFISSGYIPYTMFHYSPALEKWDYTRFTLSFCDPVIS